MQTRKIILIILTCVVAALVFLGALPMRRSYKAIISINANNTITGRTITDTTNWHTWYIDPENKRNTFQHFEVTSDKKTENFNYTLQNDNALKIGVIQLTKKNKWNTEITWIEELEIHEGIFKKLNLLFNPSQFREPFFQNIVQFKNHIEHPDSVFGGITFERIEMPFNKIVVKNDTVPVSKIEEAILDSYNAIITQIPQDIIKEPGFFLSQYEKISDSAALLSVAVEINETEKEPEVPFELTELESHQAVVMRTRSYSDIDSDVSIMYEWLKKHNERPATSFWVKHNPGNNVALASTANQLTIIQEVYSLQ
ncbi:hypothetical protein DC498_04855 [Terrimonas sp.]|uniref:hypothetical protein n=1 Tax=Terrimonas sp. TaxID=1914338 RepID=UPI000D51BD88|nr:hypothetical protein [Terrimonas sp.]PVD53210.1 hypothetical protein DC498_04855 [Terrimonas sp.]